MGDDDEVEGIPIEWAGRYYFPRRWYVVADPSASANTANCWTISPEADKPGWSTDSGCSGYGLPKWVAEEVVSRLNLLEGIARHLAGAKQSLPDKLHGE